MNSRATLFEFTSFALDPSKKRAVFKYKTEFENGKKLSFTETIILPKGKNSIPAKTLKKLMESLHIVLGISYYKFYCATNIKLPYKLSKKEAQFWNTVYQKGL